MRCVLCKDLFPPGYTNITEDGKANKCLFCERETDSIVLTTPETGTMQITKKKIVDDYLKYLKQVAENPNIKKMVIDDVVEKIKEQM